MTALLPPFSPSSAVRLRRTGELLLSFAFAAGCGPAPRIEERRVTIHAAQHCPVSQDLAFSVIYGSGDFEPRADAPPIVSLFLRDVGTVMDALPADTRSLVVDVSQIAQGIAWRGVREVPSRGPVDVFVWEAGQRCFLTGNVERRTDATFGVAGRHLVVAGGRALDGSKVPSTYVADLATGLVQRLPFGLGTRRAHATVTSFGETAEGELAPALVAGGEDPDRGGALASAEIYAPRRGAPSDIGDFEGERITLSEPRTRHAAVTLVSGETLLVGGLGDRGELLTSLEVVEPRSRRVRTAGLGLLGVPRVSPTVLRLATGEILVCGGLDRDGKAVPTLEWFNPDGSPSSKRPRELVTGRDRAFVALEAGGALAVVAPSDPNPDFRTVWLITADGTLEPGVPVDPAALDVVRLFGGPDGAPALWTGRSWMRFQPWLARFEPIGDAPVTGPGGEAHASGDRGLALWLEDRGVDGMSIAGFRFATKTRFAVVPKPLLVDGPGGLAPDRPSGVAGSAVQWVPGRGLELGPSANAFLTDVTFADFELDFEVHGQPPLVVVRDETGAELEIGGISCALAQTARTALRVQRTGKRVMASVDGGAFACSAELETESVRVALGLRGAPTREISVARTLRIVRR